MIAWRGRQNAGAWRYGAVMAILGLLGCAGADKIFCQNGDCSWSDTEASRISALATPLATPMTPPPDLSNQYVGNALAEQLGQQFFSDPRFSGLSTGSDALGRPMPFARAPKGQAINVSCFTCHDLRRGGIDPATVPGNVSIGAGWTDTNSLTVINSAFQNLYAWNGRADSLWAQATGTIEAVMGSNRAHAAWTIASFYRDAYDAVFTDYPLPLTGTIADLTPTLATDTAHAGQCQLAPDCPATCRAVSDSDPTSTATGCWPRFPLDARPGKVMGCQPGSSTEPFGDAYDCMDPDDQLALTRIVVNFGKAIAAFEFQLVSGASPFDQFVADLQSGHAHDSTAIPPEAQNGARLFVGKAGCSDCHNTPLLSDGQFHNVGIPQVGQAVPLVPDCLVGTVCDCVTPNNCLPWGARDGIAKLHKNAFLRSSMWSDDPTDTSRQLYIDTPPENYPIGAFRTPGLRGVALTAPYMHTGAFTSLEDVVAHYNQGGDPAVDGDVAAQLKPLYLSDQEQSELVAFLKTLTGAPLAPELANPPVLPM